MWQWSKQGYDILNTKNSILNLQLSIDIGNTRTKLGVFDNRKLVEHIIWNTWDLKEIKALVKKYDIQHVALSNTGKPKNKKVINFLNKETFFIALSHKTPLPIKNLYGTPKTLGRDRLAGVMGAYGLYPKKNSLVIDAGTCITYDLLTKDKNYHGGSIHPGVEMRLKAMNHFTARLPLIKRRKQKALIGKSTTTAIRIGAQVGAVAEMEGMINRYKAHVDGQLTVILTGGDADFFANQMKTKIFVNQNLVLLGLNKILNHNVQF